MEDSETLNKLAILTWRNIADSAGPCDAGGAPMTEGNLRGPPSSITILGITEHTLERCHAW